MYQLILAILTSLLLLGNLTNSANPDDRRPSSSSAKVDCSIPIGFSAIGAHRVHSTGLVGYSKTLFDQSANGFVRETGEFTINCPGVYLISFSGSAVTNNVRITLKKRSSSSNHWEEIVSINCSSPQTTCHNQILLELKHSDQIGVHQSSGTLDIRHENEHPTASFTAYRLIKT